MQRPDRGEPQFMDFTPAAELGNCLYIGHSGVLVSDRCGEELQEMLAGFVAGGGNDRRHRKVRCSDDWNDFGARRAHRMRV